MIDQLVQFDRDLFFAINHGLSNGFFDWLMPILRDRYTWVLLYLFIIVFSIKNYGKQGFIMILFLAMTFGISDFLSSSVIKPSVQRLRPCNETEIKIKVNNLVDCGTGYSFPSSHATNHFAIAVFLIMMFYHKWKIILPIGILWAASISFAQIYVGVHYPIDILTGRLLGSSIGLGMSKILLSNKSFKTWKSGN
ncbi:phosphatase PAP2 family protein [Daejeonella sp.]|uniref:phosphatase PAP2 family protein n=1 Tax=Daejeonella sp. TaxID=2805397 RepID=UPI0025BB819D|nr:phosphatase PAP2 family protein [Daejeonella sp.]